MKLEINTLYKAKVSDVKFGNVPTNIMIDLFANGRQCGVFLEYEIASHFDGLVNGTQGKAADLIDETLGTIQCKTYHRVNHEGKIKKGKDKGTLKESRKTIFTTQSGLWDSMKRRPEQEVKKMIDEYWNLYEYFMYIDIHDMKNLNYTFVVVPTKHVKQQSQSGCISLQDIMSQVVKTVTIA